MCLATTGTSEKMSKTEDKTEACSVLPQLKPRPSLWLALDHPYKQKPGRQMAAIDSRPRRPLSNAHTPLRTPPIQTPPKPPGTVPPAVTAITTHPLQFHNGRTGWPQAMQIFAANREDWRQRLENGKSIKKIYHPIYSPKDCSPQMSVQLFIDGPDGLCLKIASFTTSFLPLN